MTGLLTNYLGYGELANRPAAPSIAAGALALYWASDDESLFAWNVVEEEWFELELGGGFDDAPADTKLYGRRDGGWAEVVIPAPPVVNVQEAPEDGQQYARSDGAWEVVTHPPAVEPDVQEAPNDGKQYARKNEAWAEVDIPEQGPSLPEGGAAGQFLVKQSGVDGDADWENGIEAADPFMGRTRVALGANFAATVASARTRVTGWTELQDDVNAFAANAFTVPVGAAYAVVHVRTYWDSGTAVRAFRIATDEVAVKPTKMWIADDRNGNGGEWNASTGPIQVTPGDVFYPIMSASNIARTLNGTAGYPNYPTTIDVEWYSAHPDTTPRGLEVNIGGGGGDSCSWSHMSWPRDQFVAATCNVTGSVAGTETAPLRITPNPTFYFVNGQANGVMTWDFGVGKAVNVQGLYWQQSDVNGQGDWVLESSADTVAWTGHGAPMALGGQHRESFERANNESQRYWRIRQVSGVTSSNPYIEFIGFKQTPY